MKSGRLLLRDPGIKIVAVILGAWILALYFRSLGYPLLIGDDNFNIRYNPYYHPPTLANLARVWTNSYIQLYIPVTLSVWGVLGSFSSLVPVFQRSFLLHGINLLVHWANGLLVFLFLRDLLSYDGPELQDTAGAEFEFTPWAAALLGAALFIAHPLQVKNVAWVTGLKDLLGTFFSLLALRDFLKAGASVGLNNSEHVVIAARDFRRYGLATLWFLLGILSKPSTVMLPVLAAIVTWWVGRPWKGALVMTLPWLIISAIASVWTYLLQIRSHLGDPIVPAWLRLPGAFDNLTFYLIKAVYPEPLSHEITRHAVTRSGSWLFWAAAAASLLLLIAAWAFRRSNFRHVSGGLFFFSAGLLPVIGLVSYGHQFFSEVAIHYASFPLLGLIASAVFYFARCRIWTVVGIGGMALLALSFTTYAHVPDYSSDDALLGHILKLEPDNYWATSDQSNVLVRRADYEGAIASAKRMLALRQSSMDGKIRVLEMLVLGGRFEEATHFLSELEAKEPANGDWRVDKALVTILSGRVQVGASQLDEAVRSDKRALGDGETFVSSVLSDAQFVEGSAEALRSRLADAYRAMPAYDMLRRLSEPTPSPKTF